MAVAPDRMLTPWKAQATPGMQQPPMRQLLDCSAVEVAARRMQPPSDQALSDRASPVVAAGQMQQRAALSYRSAQVPAAEPMPWRAARQIFHCCRAWGF